MEIIHAFITLKILAIKSKEDIKKYVVKNCKVRCGAPVLINTRITTKELLLIIAENTKGKNIVDYVFKHYTSIDSREQIIYGVLYEIKKKNTLLFILKTLLKKTI